jgi:hypothetical protein
MLRTGAFFSVWIANEKQIDTSLNRTLVLLFAVMRSYYQLYCMWSLSSNTKNVVMLSIAGPINKVLSVLVVAKDLP